jgi:hypothetical protein
MDEDAGTLEHDESAEPHHYQNNCDDKKHGNPAFLLRVSRTWRGALQVSKRGGRDWALHDNNTITVDCSEITRKS